jgi:hypothetical protein
LKSEFQIWYSEEIAQHLANSGGDVDSMDLVDLTTARMKCVSAQWIVRMYDHFCTSPDIIVNGFKAIARSIDAGEPVVEDLCADGSCNSTSNETDDSDNEYDADEDVFSAYFSSEDEH